ncbi:hypothetical protein AVEN_132024-1 [Araneus ventricosus]|uniref:Uncharacterized protein n=1 Tax=Araneus ventricosus TaxID=182803 RepID=A0A4Y2B2M3_ARAVE|nr:hypothetical protein AVEN_132024-1 [Araneus ventricosus]
MILLISQSRMMAHGGNVDILYRYFDCSRHEILSYKDLASPSDEQDDIIDITVSYDGARQKRGHTSVYGIGTVVDILIGLVIGYEILSKYCLE